ncbi:hypothetical protein AA700_1742 [Acidiphilium acidophilum DSM 700]|nr:hypothetical protein AA700_1742 [Acidiphilium acidophilum DSM 700]
MMGFQTLDGFVRERIRAWPQTPPGLEMADARGKGVWLKARPGPAAENDAPSLKIPGAARMRTFPDGLWLWFGGTAADPFVDIFAIEVCGSLQNLLDKRSRYTPSLHSLLISCPAVWLKRSVAEQDDTPRWKTIGLFEREPDTTIALPVRDMRVLYALKPRHFDEFASHNIAHAHELFAPIDILVDEAGWQAPALRQFLFHAARRANFWDKAAYTCHEPWRGNAHAGSLDGGSGQIRPVGNHPVHAKPEHPLKRLGRIDRPRQHKEAERLSLTELSLIEGRMKRGPAVRPRGRNGVHHLTVECA